MVKKIILIAVILIILAVAVLVFLFFNAIKPDSEISEHLKEYSKNMKANNKTEAYKNLENVGKRFVNLLAEGSHWKAYYYFDLIMKIGLLPWNLKNSWKSNVVMPFGEPEGIVNSRVKEIAEKGKTFIVVNVTGKTINQSYFEVKIVFSQDGTISGLWFIPPDLSFLHKVPEYVNENVFSEIELTIGEGDCKLPAILSIPNGDGVFPVIVLVHGSGPNDMDETIGPNKPFKDIAGGLASKGIAVLRYEKRTRHCKIEDIWSFTVKEESIDDTLNAVEILKSNNKIDHNRIFVLGHSLGGMLAPRIASMSKDISGIIIAAGNARNLADLTIEQLDYIMSMKENASTLEKNEIEKIKKQAEQIKKLDVKDNEIILGSAKAYWKDLASYNQVETAKQLNIPILVLQGERDYQVTITDFNQWKEALKDKNNVTFISYPKLNHLFLEGEGKSKPEEYSIVGYVSKNVIDDIVNWININIE